MTRHALPFTAPDLSQFARALGRSLKARHAERADPPGHVELLNLLARAAGHRNLQALQAASAAALPKRPLAPEDRPADPALTDTARKALQQFDTRGRLIRWPNKFSVQRLAMWVLWTHFDAKRVYTEREVNEILRQAHVYGDHATLRRELVNDGLLARKGDCSEYRKVARRASDEVRGLLRAWRQQARNVER